MLGSRSPSVRRFVFVVVALGVLMLPNAGRAQTTTLPPLQPFPGGFIETATTALARPLLSSTLLGALLPARGEFTFPPPYNTTGVRITNASDCGGADCVDAVGYSYWHNVNNHVGSDEMLIVLGLNRSRGGPGPSLFSYNKVTGQVTNRGALFDSNSGRSWHSTEGWYFSGTQPTKLYVDDGPRMLRYDVLTKQYQTVFDVTTQFGSDKTIWQMHSSNDDRVHSATLRQLPTYEMLGCVVFQEDQQKFLFFPKIGDFNECHIDKSGRWLMSLEDVDYKYDLEMRIFDLQNGTERMVWDQDGAVGHADMGYGYVVGSDNWASQANAVKLWDFSKDPLSGFLVSYNLNWSAPAPNHFAHGNARPDKPPTQQYACGSGASTSIAPWANEVVCFRMDGSFKMLVVAPVMTDMNAPGGGSDPYVKEPKGNLDLTGQYFIWTSNAGGNRLDAFIVKVPALQLMNGTTDTTAPAVSITSPVSGSTQTGSIGVTAGASDDVAVAGVQFRLDGGLLGGEVTAPPYAVTLNTTGVGNGAHSLTATARDAAGNSTVSTPVGITVMNDATPPAITLVGVSGISTTGATLAWTTNEPSDTQAEYGPTIAYGTLSPLNGTAVTAHSVTLGGLSSGAVYHYRVRSRDAAGNLAVSGDFSFATAGAPAAPVPPTTGHQRPIGHWRFSEWTGSLTGDASGSGYTGGLVNGPAWETGVTDRALSFDGVNDYVTVAHAAPLDAYPITVAAWIRTTSTGLGGVINKYLPSSMNGYQIFMNGGNLCAWYFKDSSSFVWDGTSCTLATPGANDGRWHHVAFVVDASGGRLYLDGTLKASRAWTGTPGPATTTTDLSFGRYPNIATPYWPGALDELRLYGRSLSPGEIATEAGGI